MLELLNLNTTHKTLNKKLKTPNTKACSHNQLLP